MDDEKRTEDSVRLRKFIDVAVEDKASSTVFRGAIADISTTGMRVITDQYLPEGTRYTFAMKRVPFLALRGDVRWIRPFERDTFQCGVLFVDLTDDERDRLQRFTEFERRRGATSS